ncbi:MAG: M15 family metallopeptidase [Bacteroidales bacterium]|jgi:hypothetical protein
MNPSMKWAQTALKSLGYAPGAIDGITGPATGSALAQAILDGKVDVLQPEWIAFKKNLKLNQPTRRTINDVYGTPKYKEGPKKGAITILNPTEWRRNFTTIELQASDDGKTFKIMVNRKITLNLLCAFAEIKRHNRTLPVEQRWSPLVLQCYCPRHMRWDAAYALTVHTWAAAIDVDPKKNGVGMKSNIPAWVIAILQAWGATWGGEWKSYPDPMHFQWMR